MNQPRNPSHQTSAAQTAPQPDPATVIEYVRHVLGVSLADWQAGALYDTYVAYGYAVLASVDVDDVEDQPADVFSPTPLPMTPERQAKRETIDSAYSGPRPAGASEGGRAEPRPYAPTRIAPSQSPIGDSLLTDPRDA